ncbi:Cys/Met metabolism pyridoxal-phosphate-dependent enzyme [Alteromonas alba]|uniref:Cys/Met metabolism pyridoxal-phosphate-dependent enzyme n=1 Tax=Alteromonas alba TaxID=2079529 RepID=A0A2S9V512_9ALTE|nr:PLP-dependent transferase [Alteromonas alba]PRO71538.1 Cys/Met metabolism pyridoxal-phosphate-dependent enzyme [Alteromonas alba]
MKSNQSLSVETCRPLSPRRHTSDANSVEQLVEEQLAHFNIRPDTAYGQALADTARHLYGAQQGVQQLWQVTRDTLERLDQSDKLSYFNAKKFLSFQIAKVLDTLQNPFRQTWQSLNKSAPQHYPIFDNVPALFSATPAVVKTATYVYACTEWIEDAFEGKESTHQIYSRLMNPTNISLANAIVDLEAGDQAGAYLAWNFNSGMAAIDALLSNVLSHGDILIVSRNVYGGVYQLLHDFFARENRLNVTLAWFDGYSAEEFADHLANVQQQYADKLAAGNRLHVYIESPCNPHGLVLDVPGICKLAHAQQLLVMLDSTLATPVLHKPLQHADKQCRPDYVVHSYTKDICGTGTTTAGVVIGENHRMFQPKGTSCEGVDWSQTLFWDVYYIKGAFLDSEKAFDVLTGMKTLTQRMLTKVINTQVFTHFLDSHPHIKVNSHALSHHENAGLREQQHSHGWPCALFTAELDLPELDRVQFARFFDSLEPAFGHQISIGQTNTLILCPALTSHSEMSRAEQQKASIALTTMRIAMGCDCVKSLIAHFVLALKQAIDPIHPGFSDSFMAAARLDELHQRVAAEVHAQYYGSQPTLVEMLK